MRLLMVCHRARLRVFGLISTISSEHVRSDAAMAAFTLSSTPEIADRGAKTLPTGEISGLTRTIHPYAQNQGFVLVYQSRRLG